MPTRANLARTEYNLRAKLAVTLALVQLDDTHSLPNIVTFNVLYENYKSPSTRMVP